MNSSKLVIPQNDNGDPEGSSAGLLEATRGTRPRDCCVSLGLSLCSLRTSEPATQTNLDPRGAGREGFLTGENVVPKLGSDLEGIRDIWGERYQETH